MPSIVIKLNSISDVITNSSSEVFTVLANGSDSTETIADTIKEYARKHSWSYHYAFDEGYDKIPECLHDIITPEAYEEIVKRLDKSSGMGGDIDVIDWKTAYEDWKRDTFLKDRSPEKWAECIGVDLDTLKKYVVVDLDWGRQATIRFIKKHFTVVEENDETRKIINWFTASEF